MDTSYDPLLLSSFPIEEFDPVLGELYLFHTSDPACPSEECLWAVVAQYRAGRLVVESGTTDLSHFDCWFEVSSLYRYVRSATREELRDYSYNLAHAECAKHSV
ncbi:MAG: hypothetical protein IKU77_02910 [Alistipes sp.]|nr:hypothetical protein [Alistipes sp.]